MKPILTANSPLRKAFVLRLWKGSRQAAEWAAEVQVVSSGEVKHAYGWEALVELLRGLILEDVPDAPHADAEADPGETTPNSQAALFAERR